MVYLSYISMHTVWSTCMRRSCVGWAATERYAGCMLGTSGLRHSKNCFLLRQEPRTKLHKELKVKGLDVLKRSTISSFNVFSSIWNANYVRTCGNFLFFWGGGQTDKKHSQGVLLPYTIILFVYLSFVSWNTHYFPSRMLCYADSHTPFPTGKYQKHGDNARKACKIGNYFYERKTPQLCFPLLECTMHKKQAGF